MKVIALDPGVTTGYAVGVIDGGLMQVVTGQEKWIHSELYGFLGDNKPDVLISEKFEFRNRARTGLELISREFIGVANLYAQLFMPEPHELVMQMPGSVISGYFSKPSNMKEVYKPGKIHSNEAAMHLLHWFQFGSGFQYNSRGFEGAA